MTRSVLLLLPWAALLASCAGTSSQPLATEERVEVNRYTGKWYEIARYPKWFQRGCESATAEYSKNPDGSIRVLNTCIRKDGSTRSIEGLAKPVDASESRLQVSFPGNWYSKLIPVPKDGNYWIIDVSSDYRQAIVGTPDRKSLWFLSRSSSIPSRDFERMKTTAARQGFDLSKLKMDAHTKVGGS